MVGIRHAAGRVNRSGDSSYIEHVISLYLFQDPWPWGSVSDYSDDSIDDDVIDTEGIEELACEDCWWLMHGLGDPAEYDEQGILGVNDETSALTLSGYCTIFWVCITIVGIPEHSPDRAVSELDLPLFILGQSVLKYLDQVSLLFRNQNQCPELPLTLSSRSTMSRALRLSSRARR